LPESNHGTQPRANAFYYATLYAWVRAAIPSPETTTMAHRCRKNDIDGPSMLFQPGPFQARDGPAGAAGTRDDPDT
jgi:hypothetical protein